MSCFNRDFFGLYTGDKTRYLVFFRTWLFYRRFKGFFMIYAYLRVSTHGQDTKSQKMDVLTYAQTNKLIIDDFIEIEMSSSKSQQARKIDSLKSKLKKDDTLIVAELSRLGRNMLEILNLVNELNKKGVKIIFTRQPELSTEGSFRDLLLAVYSYFAQAERELMAERTKAGLARAREKGKVIGRPKGKLGVSKYDEHRGNIELLLGRGLSINSIASILKGSRSSLSYYIETRKIKPSYQGRIVIE